MLEAELDPGPEACRTKSSLAARRKRQKTRAFTVIKMGLRSICKDPPHARASRDSRAQALLHRERSAPTSHPARHKNARGRDRTRKDRSDLLQSMPVCRREHRHPATVRHPRPRIGGDNTRVHGAPPGSLPAGRQSNMHDPDAEYNRKADAPELLCQCPHEPYQSTRSMASAQDTAARRRNRSRLVLPTERTTDYEERDFDSHQILHRERSIGCQSNRPSRCAVSAFPVQSVSDPPPAELAWMKPLCAEVRTKIGPLPVRASTKAYLYLLFLHSMLHGLEDYNLDTSASNKDSARGFKLFSILPQKKLRPVYISIDNSTLLDIHSKLLADAKPNRKEKRGRSEPECVNSKLKKMKALRGKALWTHYFKVESLRFSGGREFEAFITTDGLSVSVVLSRPKCDPVETVTATEGGDAERMRALLEGATRVVAADPGCNLVLTAVVHNERALEELHSPCNIKNVVVKWSRARFHYEAGHKHRNKSTARWIDKSSSVTTFNKQVRTARTGDLTAIRKHVCHVLANCRMMLEFFCAQHFKRLRWKTYIRTQKTYEKIVADLNGGCKKTLVVWGDTHFPANGRGSPSVPTSTLRKVGARVTTVTQDEFWTSKLSCCCNQVMTQFVTKTKNRSWTLRVCQNNECARNVWDRNVSGAINTLKLLLARVGGQQVNLWFSRGTVMATAV